jgi:hypothetical protein
MTKSDWPSMHLYLYTPDKSSGDRDSIRAVPENIDYFICGSESNRFGLMPRGFV